MQTYQFDETTARNLAESCIPYAIFQQVGNHVVPLLVSDGFCELFRVERGDAMDRLSQHLFDNDHPDDVARLGNAIRQFSAGEGELDLLFRARAKEGYRILHICGKHVYVKGGTRLAVVWYMDEGEYSGDKKSLFDQVMDTMLHQARKQSAQDYEPMTGLPQVNYFFRLAGETCAKIRAAGEKPALMYFDFNDMKGYNQKHSFAQGDLLLLGLRDTMVKHFSRLNCCRLGGDHFIALASSEGLEEKLADLFSDVEKINHGDSQPVRVGICLNVPESGSIGPAFDLAKTAADQKRESPVSAFTYYTEEMQKKARLRGYILENLDKALKEGWIQVYYQPIVRVANGSVCDEEALARWIDPVMGFLSPGDFIPVLEESGQVYKVDLFVVDRILEKMRQMGAKGYFVVPCSVNISRSDFKSCDVVSEISRRVDEAGISRDMLTIEITESTVGSDLDYISQQVDALTDMGFRVWMDDYGSGYSSPDILQRFPFETIKLDMQFMRQFDKGYKSRIIISELIKMAMNLGLETVVEGVETEEQVEFLREVGATKMQGFYYCKPIPLEEILRRYKEGSQIGFENPAESGYYSTIGKVNLYDISLSSNENEGIGEYFNTMPMAIFEVGETDVHIIRCNQSYHTMLREVFQTDEAYIRLKHDRFGDGYGAYFMRVLLDVARNGGQQIIDEKTASRKNLKVLLRKLADNPISHVGAVAVILLDIADDNVTERTLSFGAVAQALSADYLYLYHVDLATDYYVEYHPDAEHVDIVAKTSGDDFFGAAKRDAEFLIHPDDLNVFSASFTKENLMESLRTHHVYTKTYRMQVDGEWIYVSMKAIRIGSDGNHIIIGINNVDAQMQQQNALERLREEKLVYSRICALSGEYIAFYTVDIETGHFMVFNADADYQSLGVAREGEDFFGQTLRDIQDVVYPEDLDKFYLAFGKEPILAEIEEKGSYHLKYRLMIDGSPHPVILKATKTMENGEERLIVGVRYAGY